jgi:hypothetical protein
MFSMKWLVSLAVAVGVGAAGVAYFRPAIVSAEPQMSVRSAATAPAPAPTQVIVREVVREVRTEPSPEAKAAAEEQDPVVAQEMAAVREEERLARVDAELEANFRAAAAPDHAAVKWESNLIDAFAKTAAQSSTIQCRSSFCRIDATFGDEPSAQRDLSQIFMSGPDERLPNLASTVSRTIGDDGRVRVKIYLHPDVMPQNSSK